MDGELLRKGDKYFVKFNRKEYPVSLNSKMDIESGETVPIDDIEFTENRRIITINSFKFDGLLISVTSQVNIEIPAINQNPVNTDPGTAPYNFVELYDRVLIPEASFKKQDESNIKYSGHIKLNIKTKSPIFIRGKDEEFFKINNKLTIPGSSLRGMIRNLVEIVSYSKLDLTDKFKPIYYRNIKDKFYRDKFLSANQPVETFVKSGWLKKEGNEYRLHKCHPIIIENVDVTIFKLNTISLHINDNSPEMIYFDKANVSRIHISVRNNRTTNLVYNKINAFSLTQTTNCDQKAFVLSTGFVAGKHFHWVVSPPKVEFISLPSTIIEKYNRDVDRNDACDLLKFVDNAEKKRSEYGYPCFYLEKNGEITMIGHTGMFRLLHESNVESLLPSDHNSNDTVNDLTQNLFGTTSLASRIFFEDLVATNASQDQEEALNILSEPSISYFPNYLQQPNSFMTPRAELHHWSTPNAKIRGIKLYWHRNSDQYKNEGMIVDKDYFRQKIGYSENQFLNFLNVNQDWIYANEANDKLKIEKKYSELSYEIKKVIKDWIYSDSQGNSEIKKLQFSTAKVVKEDSEFEGRIRFENLEDYELGALLSVLELPPECHHKIGMGKPLGLGSIAITPTLVLSDLTKRYKRLFDDKLTRLYEPLILDKDRKIEHFKEQFAKKILEFLGKSTLSDPINDLWEEDRMKDLNTILDFSNVNIPMWNTKTKYMDLIEFSDRKVIGTPDEVAR